MVERERVCVGVLEAVGGCDGEEGKTRDGLRWPRFYVDSIRAVGVFVRPGVGSSHRLTSVQDGVYSYHSSGGRCHYDDGTYHRDNETVVPGLIHVLGKACTQSGRPVMARAPVRRVRRL